MTSITPINFATTRPARHAVSSSRPQAVVEAGDKFIAGPDMDAGIYHPNIFPGAKPVDVEGESRKLAEGVWKGFAVARDGRERAPQISERYRVLGHPRINRSYPDRALEAAGVEQDLPMEVSSPFKWLMSKPLVLGENKDTVLLHAQFEGGPTWLEDGEYECRDFFIALRRDSESGTYKEMGSLMTRKPDWQDVFRTNGPLSPVPGKANQFMAHFEEGTYTGIYGNYTHLYEVSDDGVRQIGGWNGHKSAEEISKLSSERDVDSRTMNNPDLETLERLNYSRNWQNDKSL